MRRICRPVWSHIAAHIADCLCFCSLSARNSAGGIPGCTSCICITEFEGHIDDALHFLTAWHVKKIYPEAELTTIVETDRHASRHREYIPEPRLEMISGFPNPALATRRWRRTQTQARFHATPDHENKMANRPMDLTTMPSALLARRLRSSLWCQKRVVAGHRGRSAKKYDFLFLDTNITY
jgi:hypothetical protein